MRNRRLAVIAALLSLAAVLLLLLAPRPQGSRLLHTVVLPPRFLALHLAVDSSADHVIAQTWDESGPLATLSGLAVFDGRDGTLRQVVRMPQGAAARALVMDRLTGRTFVVRTATLHRVADLGDTGHDLLSVYDPASGALVSTLPLGRSPAAVAIGTRTGRLYLLTNTLLSTSRPVHVAAAVLDGRSGRTLRTMQTAAPPNAYAIGLAVDEQAGRLLVIAENLPKGYFDPHGRGKGARPASVSSLYVLDLHGALLARMPLGVVSAQATTLAVDSARGRALLVTPGRVRVIDSRTGQLIRDVALPGAQAEIVLDHAAGRAFIPLAGRLAGGLATIDSGSGILLHSTALAPSMQAPTALALDEHTHRLFVLDPRLSGAGQRAGQVAVLDSDTGRLLETVQVGGAPYSLVVDEGAGRVLVFSRGYGRQPAPSGARLVTAESPWWAQPPGWLPWLQRQAAPPPNTEDPTVSVLDATR